MNVLPAVRSVQCDFPVFCLGLHFWAFLSIFVSEFLIVYVFFFSFVSSSFAPAHRLSPVFFIRLAGAPVAGHDCRAAERPKNIGRHVCAALNEYGSHSIRMHVCPVNHNKYCFYSHPPLSNTF